MLYDVFLLIIDGVKQCLIESTHIAYWIVCEDMSIGYR